MSKASENIASKIAVECSSKNGSAFDPMTIMMIASFVIQLAKAVYECRKSKNKTIDAMHNPGFIYKILLGRYVNKFIKDNNLNIKKAELMDALLKTKFSKEEISLLVAEALSND